MKDVEERLSGQIGDLEKYLETILQRMDKMKESGERVEAKLDELAKRVSDLEKRTSVMEDCVLEMGRIAQTWRPKW